MDFCCGGFRQKHSKEVKHNSKLSSSSEDTIQNKEEKRTKVITEHRLEKSTELRSVDTTTDDVTEITPEIKTELVTNKAEPVSIDTIQNKEETRTKVITEHRLEKSTELRSVDTKTDDVTEITPEIKTELVTNKAEPFSMSTKKQDETAKPKDKEEEDEKVLFVISPKLITVGSSFKLQYKRPRGGGPTVKGWIGLYKKGDGEKSYITHYYDTNDTLASSIAWAKGPNRSGEWEFRYYDRDYKLLAISPVKAVSETIHRFNDRYPSKDSRVTINSKQVQSTFWPDYLSEDTTRLFVMERSKNPSLVVYYANLRSDNSYPYVKRNIIKDISKESSRFDSDEPVRVRWYSWGWTKEPEINALSMLQIPFMGVSMKQSEENEFTGTLNALKDKSMRLCIRLSPRTNKFIPALVGTINGKNAILRKVFVKTKSSWTGMPTVEYADVYGIDLKSGKEVQERIKQ